MNYDNFVGVFLTLLLSGSCALEYSLLESLDVTCLPRNNCRLVNARKANFTDRSCECDSQCNNYQDCCIDRASLAPLVSEGIRKYPCMTYGGQNKVGVYVVDTCPYNYSDSPNIRNMCQEGDNFSDPLASAPVSIVSTRTTFKNRYCAECNGAAPSSLTSWLTYLNCETLTPLQLNESYIRQNLEYNPSLSTWGITIHDEFHRCELIYDKPINLMDVRFCRANTVDTCHSSFASTSVKRLCESYSAVVYDTENAYKNPHCAICNNKSLNDLTCLDPALFKSNAKKVPFSFALLLDMNLPEKENLNPRESLEECPDGEIYDSFFRKCRRLFCALPGYKVVNGMCLKMSE